MVGFKCSPSMSVWRLFNSQKLMLPPEIAHHGPLAVLVHVAKTSMLVFA